MSRRPLIGIEYMAKALKRRGVAKYIRLWGEDKRIIGVQRQGNYPYKAFLVVLLDRPYYVPEGPDRWVVLEGVVTQENSNFWWLRHYNGILIPELTGKTLTDIEQEYSLWD